MPASTAPKRQRRWRLQPAVPVDPVLGKGWQCLQNGYGRLCPRPAGAVAQRRAGAELGGRGTPRLLTTQHHAYVPAVAATGQGPGGPRADRIFSLQPVPLGFPAIQDRIVVAAKPYHRVLICKSCNRITSTLHNLRYRHSKTAGGVPAEGAVSCHRSWHFCPGLKEVRAAQPARG